MDGFQILCTIFIIVLTYARLSGADHEYMLTNPEPVIVDIDYETKLQCLMNIEPDKFQWKFYPLPAKDASNPRAIINLGRSDFTLIPENNYTTQRRQSDLNLQADSKDVAGDYQCLAYYGASVVASIPWRVTIGVLKNFPKQESVDITVSAGNTINWRCESPESNPEASIDYLRNGQYVLPFSLYRTKSLIISNVTSSNSGKYTCKAVNSLLGSETSSSTIFNLKVVQNGPTHPPRFIVTPKKIYTVNKGDTVFLECSAVGNPIPQIIWEKRNGQIPKRRADMINGGLIIKNVSSSDDGTYVCNQKNHLGSISHEITLEYNEPPSIDCLLNSTDIKQGENLDLDCIVNGTPEPEITWFLNGFSVSNDSTIEAVDNKINFRPVEKRHAGNLQIFARNIVKTVYSSISIKVIPKSTSIDEAVIIPTRSTHRHKSPKGNGNRKSPKHTKMIPPSKPTISRLTDDSVVIRWSVPLNKGLPIQFFKIQYKELGPANSHDHHTRAKGSKWMTTNADIAPHLRNYMVNNLKPDYWYRFRIAAVYTNNDNKNSPNSDKFHLRKLDFDNRNPLPVPMITGTESVNTTAVKIYWKYNPSPNVTVDGFYVNYLSASSAADYLQMVADGEDTNSYILSHLQPDTVYDIKLQSFSSKSASEFSSIMRAKTLGAVSTPPPSVRETIATTQSPENGQFKNIYYIITPSVIAVGGLIISLAVLAVLYRKWKGRKNTRNDRDKPAVDDRHIQADGNEYVATPKSQHRPNGCVSSNRITITANPLADADNKNQNMIEMSCLSSQNNNCSTTVQPSASGEDSPTSSTPTNTSKDKKNKTPQKRICNNKHNVDSTTSGENYV